MKTFNILFLLITFWSVNALAQTKDTNNFSDLMAFNSPLVKAIPMNGNVVVAQEVNKIKGIGSASNDSNRWRNMPKANMHPDATIGLHLFKDEPIFILVLEQLSLTMEQIGRAHKHNE
jgi:hypothetical protein